jgi:serine-type D-Ala-D-Ala carboxypeptidase (penicillin-binding protein 5/6)
MQRSSDTFLTCLPFPQTSPRRLSTPTLSKPALPELTQATQVQSLLSRSVLSWCLSLLLLTLALVAPATLAPAQQTPAQQTDAVLASALTPLITAHRGDVAVGVRHLALGTEFLHRSQTAMSTASLIKFPIMVETYRQAAEGQVDLDQLLEVQASDRVPGSGILTTHFSPGVRLSLRDAVHLMIAFSDNTATNLVLDQIGLPATNTTMQAWGYPETQIHSKVYRRDTSIALERSQRYGLGSTTADDMLALLARLHAGELVSPTASQAMLAHLSACDDNDKFPALLPPGTKLAHKTGSVGNIRTSAGILETPAGAVALCVLTENNQDTRWTRDNAGDRLCAEIAKVVFDHFSDVAATARSSGSRDASSPGDASTGTADGATPSAPTDNRLAKGATGELVEALQRTLNARSPSKPGLSVDGDFGAATEKAVQDFQTANQLAATGIVDRDTWQALGSLLLEDQPAPEPETVNAEQLPKQPADDPYGQPQVTCKAWSIADAKTGEVLWHHQGDQALDIASTTKIMTALLVLERCAVEPDTLSETVTFSQRADRTPGSTAGLRAGEQTTVKDLLYGLMLPSGNDASVAFAEHFGARLRAADAPPDETAYASFIAAMNRRAAELGMDQTRYINPHGLTAAGHRSTANDLIKLTLAARRLPAFCEVTSTRQFGTQVTSTSGYRRNVKWENTNQLLPVEGYLGVKTGTTDAAGACLVSCATRGERQLVAVVLGSATSAVRYTDTRNLLAWAWRELDKQP